MSADARSPMVSVVMPCHNGERFVRQAIESVRAQTFPDWELLVIDNNSIDRSLELLEDMARSDPRIVVLQCTEPGAANARNAGILRARGRYIAFLDCDDYWLPEKLQYQVSAMLDARAGMCWSAYRVVDGSDRPLREQKAAPTTTYEDHMAKRNVIGCLTVMYDAVLLGRQTMPLIRMRQDYGLWARLIRLSTDRGLPLVGLQNVLACYRVHPAAMTSNKLKAAYFQWRLYRDIEGLSLPTSARYFGSYILQALSDRRRASKTT